MGQSFSVKSEYAIPTTKNFKLSYCINRNIKQIVEKKETVDLSNLIEEQEYTCGLLMLWIYTKLKHHGYTIKDNLFEQRNYRIENILNLFSEKGIPLSNGVLLNDVKIESMCYESNLNNMYSLLNNGKILLGGIILTSSFLKEVLNITLPKQTTISDIVLIVGYNTSSFYLKTEWCKEILRVDNRFISNIKEIWDVEIKTFC